MKLQIALAICVFALRSASAVESPLPSFDDAEQDKQGVIWALARAEPGQLRTFDGQQWSLVTETALFQPSIGNDAATPLRFLRLPDGSVACLWNLGKDRLAITRHAAGKSELISVFPAKIPDIAGLSPCLFFDSDGQFWVTGCGPEIHRIDREGHATLACEIQPDQFLKAAQTANTHDQFRSEPTLLPTKPADANGNTRAAIRHLTDFLLLNTTAKGGNPVCMAEDGRGRIWAWSETLTTDLPSLEGVLIFDGEKVEQHRQFDGIDGTTFSVIIKKDDKHMWVASRMEGLFEVDIDTLKATPVDTSTPRTGPITGDLDEMVFVFREVEMIFSEGTDWYLIDDGLRSKSDLWRLRERKWTAILQDMDGFFRDPADASRRAWLNTGKGIVLRSFDTARPPWFVSEAAPPAHLEWQKGLELKDAKKMFLLADGIFFALGAKGQIFHDAISLPPKPDPVSRVMEVQIQDGWCLDGNDHVWSVLRDAPNVLSEWDSGRWVPHEFPAELRGQDVRAVTIDTRDRVWVLPDTDQSPAGYCDTHDGKWHAYPTVGDAYAALKDEPPLFERDHLNFYVPHYSPDRKRIVFRSSDQEEVVYFDGTAWHRWSREPNYKLGGGTHPFFATDGHLCVTASRGTWQLDDQGEWHELEMEIPYSPIKPAGNTGYKPPAGPPEGCVTNSPDSIAQDNHGTFWLTWQGKLYKSVPGTCTEVFSKDEPDPFADGSAIREAWVDRRNNVFLKTTRGVRIIAAPESPPPKASTDAESQADAPADAKSDAKTDAERQIAVFIGQLADSDYSKRGAAVTALVRQPAIALSALKATRGKAGEDQRWWIDVAIQEIERQSGKGSTSASD